MGEVVVVVGRMSIFKVFPKGQTYVVRAHSQSYPALFVFSGIKKLLHGSSAGVFPNPECLYTIEH